MSRNPRHCTFLLALALVCLSPTAAPGEDMRNQHWNITLGEVYRVNSFFCTSEQGIDELIEARMTHYKAPSVPFRFPDSCKLAQFAFRPLKVTRIEKSYYLAQRDSESETDCRNSKGKVYKCSFIQFTSRYIFGELLLDGQTLDVYVEAPPSITVTMTDPGS